MPKVCKITENGNLYFKKGSRFKRICCVNKWSYCHDACPYFHTHQWHDSLRKLHLCNDIEYVFKIIDERIDNQDNPNDSIEDDLDNINLKLEKREN